jgi:hypothetical protein
MFAKFYFEKTGLLAAPTPRSRFKASCLLQSCNYLHTCIGELNLEKTLTHAMQGCQMVYFQTKNPNLGKFWRALEWKMIIYYMIIWNILRPFGR